MAKSKRNLSRRQFLQGTGAAVAAFSIAPASILGGPNRLSPNEKINVACIGVGGRGHASVRACAGAHNIVGLCDVDEGRGGKAFSEHPKAKKFQDFRKMLDAMEKEVDAVTVGTPDHTHAPAVMNAIRRGKHVYCEKPLAHSVHEVRAIMDATAKHKVVTQLGNQGHSFESIRQFCEWIWDGAIGKVSEVHACCDAFRDVYCQIDKLPKLAEKPAVPKGLNYDLWLGPAKYIPYSPLWVPWNWRGWMPFGTGCLGDWACHVMDPSFWAFDLEPPTSVVAEVKGYDPAKHELVYPRGTRITFQFAAKGDRGPIKLVWFDGSERPPQPEGGKAPGTGAVVYGDKGIIVHGSHGAGGVKLVPEEKMKAYKQPEKTIPRVKNHHWDWLEAIRTGREAGSNFQFGGPMTETALLGAVAIRFPGQELKWDSKAMKVTNNDAANQWIAPPYRDGWEL